jgi:hypothetical protein
MSDIPGDFGAHSKAAKSAHNNFFVFWLITTFGQQNLRKGVIDIAGGKGTVSYSLSLRYGINCTLIEPREVVLDSMARKRMVKICEQRASGADCYVRPDIKYSPAPDDKVMLDHVVNAAYRSELPFRHIKSEFWYPFPENSVLHTAEVMKLLTDATVIVGMHPDQATESIIDAAIALGLSFAVLPCCLFSNIFPNRYLINDANGSGGSTNEDCRPVRTYDDFVDYLAAKDKSIQIAYLPFEGRNKVLYRIMPSLSVDA